MKLLVVIMGVSGAGKTTVGMLLAERLGVAFTDADDLHPAPNVWKMAAGEPLTDDDRAPWLAEVGSALRAAGDTGLVMACSTLKRQYRRAILDHQPLTRFVLLDAPRALLERRLAGRAGHFMPGSLLDSQLATLEVLGADEPGVTVTFGADDSAEAIAERAEAALLA